MTPEQTRLALVVAMLACSGLLLVYPVEPSMTSEMLFDDEVDKRIKAESVAETTRSQLTLRIRHDDGGRITDDLSRVQDLMQLEQDAMGGSNPDTAWDDESNWIARMETPFKRWSEAFASRNRSLANASYFQEVLEPEIPNGWCGNNSTDAEQAAFEATLLMLPEDTILNIACPAFAGTLAILPPAANEVLWMVWMESDEENPDWSSLSRWAEKVSDSTDYEVSAVGMNMLFAKSKDIAQHDLTVFMLPAVVLLTAILAIGLRDAVAAGATLGGLLLVLGTELGVLSALGFKFSILDGIAIPIIMGVAVDGAFWYCRSSRDRDEVRQMLFLAMVTTVAAVSLALFSSIRAHRTLAMVMIIGIILDWVVTRYLLEGIYLRRRLKLELGLESKSLPSHQSMSWCWPIALVLLASIAVIAPPGVEIFDIDQLLPEDDPGIAELEDLQSRYVLASSTVAWVIVDVDGNSTAHLQQVRDLQRQLGQHPSVISFDTGVFRTPMVIGVSNDDGDLAEPTIDQVSEMSNGSILIDDARLQRDGVTTGVAITVLIDGQNAAAALRFSDDVVELLDENELQGYVGGDMPVGAGLARTFEAGRVSQILSAGAVIFLVSLVVLRSPLRAARIAVGTIAIGGAVDGMASLFGGRGVTTAPAVLLGMGFAADYLAHATAEHPPTRMDTYARWLAALTSVSIFAMIAFADFPPAMNTGQLLTASILFSVILATCLSFKQLQSPDHDTDE